MMDPLSVVCAYLSVGSFVLVNVYLFYQWLGDLKIDYAVLALLYLISTAVLANCFYCQRRQPC